MNCLNDNVLFWGFTTSDLKEVVKNICNINPNAVWVGKGKDCHLSIVDFYEYEIEKIKKFKNNNYSIKLTTDEKNRIYSVLQREFIAWGGSHIDFLQLTNFYINWYCCFLLEHKINLIWFSYIPHQGSELILYYVSKHMKIKTKMFYQSLFSNRTFVIDEIDQFGDFPNHFGKYPKFSEEVVFGKPEQELFYMNNIAKPDSNFNFALKLIKKRIKNRVKGKVSQIGVIPLLHVLDVRKQWINYLGNKKWDDVDVENMNYVYFPLHMQPELTTDPLGSFYSDQIFAIESLRKKIPKHVSIIIKENPKQTFEWREVNFYKRIERLENVFFVDSSVNTYYLLRHSQAVATITGTAGWEAILAGKPVIIFGSAWYKSLYGAFDVRKKNFDWEKIESFIADFDCVSKQLEKMASHLPEAITDMHYIAIYPQYNSFENQNAIKSILCDGGEK